MNCGTCEHWQSRADKLVERARRCHDDEDKGSGDRSKLAYTSDASGYWSDPRIEREDAA